MDINPMDYINYGYQAFKASILVFCQNAYDTGKYLLSYSDTTFAFFEGWIAPTETRIEYDYSYLVGTITSFCFCMTKLYYRCFVAVDNLSLMQKIKLYYHYLFHLENTEKTAFKNTTYYLHKNNTSLFYEESIQDNLPEGTRVSENEKQYLLTMNYLGSLTTKIHNPEIQDAIVVVHDSEPLPYKTFVYVVNDMDNNPILNKKPSKVKFLYVEYKNNRTGVTVELHIDQDYYISGNQLFSSTFVYQLLQNRMEQSHFDMDYTVQLVDNRIQTVVLQHNEYLVLYDEIYDVKESNKDYRNHEFVEMFKTSYENKHDKENKKTR